MTEEAVNNEAGLEAEGQAGQEPAPEVEEQPAENLDPFMFPDEIEDANASDKESVEAETNELEDEGSDDEDGDSEPDDDDDRPDWLKKSQFKDGETMFKSYKELQRKLTEKSEEYKALKQQIEVISSKLSLDKQSPDPQISENDVDAILDKFAENPEGWTREQAAQIVREELQREKQYDAYRDSIDKEAFQLALQDNEEIADLSEEELALMDEMKESSVLFQGAYVAANKDNFDKLDRDKLIDLWKDAYQKMALAARGRLAHKKLAEIKAKTKREEKAKNLRNKNLQVMNPTGKRQIAGGNTSADDEAEIASILSASGK